MSNSHLPEEFQALFDTWIQEALSGWEFGRRSGRDACLHVLCKAKIFYDKKIENAYENLAEKEINTP